MATPGPDDKDDDFELTEEDFAELMDGVPAPATAPPKDGDLIPF